MKHMCALYNVAFAIFCLFVQSQSSVLKHTIVNGEVLLLKLLVTLCSFVFLAARWCNWFGLKSLLGDAAEINFHIIFYDHISCSNDRVLKNFVIKNLGKRPYETKSRNDHF